MWTRKGTQKKKQNYRQRKYRQVREIHRKESIDKYICKLYGKVYIDKSSSYINKYAIQLSMPLYLNNFCLFSYLILILKGSIWCLRASGLGLISSMRLDGRKEIQ